MKNKKIIAIALCAGIIGSSFGGVLTTYAKDEVAKKEAAEGRLEAKKAIVEGGLDAKKVASGGGIDVKKIAFDESAVHNIPELKDTIDVEPKVFNPDDIPNQKIMVDSADSNKGTKSAQNTEAKVLYEGTQSTLDPKAKDRFNLGEEEINEMMQKGYSVKDIFQADEVGNELYIEPEELLEKKASSKKSFDQIKKDILEKSKEKTIKKLKNKYKNEYKKLKNENLKESEIVNVLSYAGLNDAKVTDKLINKYKQKGDKIFEENNLMKAGTKNEISTVTKTNIEAKDLPEEVVDKLEKLSKENGSSVDELVNYYNKSKAKRMKNSTGGK